MRARTNKASLASSRLSGLWRRAVDQIRAWKISPLMLATLSTAILLSDCRSCKARIMTGACAEVADFHSFAQTEM